MTKSSRLTPAMKSALRALYQARTAVITGQRILGAGEFLPFDGKTFLKLVGLGLVAMDGNRLVPTKAGEAIAAQLPVFERMDIDEGSVEP